jgi:hypothetical protein
MTTRHEVASFALHDVILNLVAEVNMEVSEIAVVKDNLGEEVKGA